MASKITDQANYDTANLDKITEGKASILFPKGNKVFYNPIQQFNRDISILGIRAWSQLFESERRPRQRNLKRKNKVVAEEVPEKFSKISENEKAPSELNTQEVHVEENTEEHTEKEKREESEQKFSLPLEEKPYIEIIEALSASGLRAIRYGKEIPRIKNVIANDFSASAVQSIKQNARFSGAEAVVTPHEGDASMLMYKHKLNNVHVVDLDPYGSATPFMDAAVQAVKNGGLILVTCTDLGVLAGNSYTEKCFSQYGGTTLYSDASHESALRLVLNMVASTAAKYGRSIEPLLSLSIDFYVRLFIRIKTSPLAVKHNASSTMVVYHCNGCGSTITQPLGKATPKSNGNFKFGYARGPVAPEKCTFCGSYHHIAGPMWGGPIHNDAFIDSMLTIHKTLDPEVYKTIPRIQGMLTLAKDELKDVPFYFNPQNLASVVRSSSPPHRKILSALCNAGYRVSFTHALPGGIKTDAPYSVIWDILRQWIKDEHNGEVSKNLKAGSPGTGIVKSLDTETPVSFSDNERALELERLRKSKVVRFQVNPTKNWGPKAKAPSN